MANDKLLNVSIPISQTAIISDRINLSYALQDEVTGNAIPHATYVVQIDDSLGSSVFSEVVHVHAAFTLIVDGEVIDLAKPEFMLKDNLIHLDELDGNTLHTHGRDVTLGKFFHSIGMSHDNITNCLTNIDGQEYCNDTVLAKKVRFWINGEELQGALENHVIAEKDRILVVYGNEDSARVRQYLYALNGIPIKRA